MPRLIRTRQAKEDVLSIWSYIAQHDTTAADKLVQKINDLLKKLAAHPGMGTLQEQYREGLRCFPIGKYVIFYEQVENGIQVIRILHGARRLEDLL
ncbi:type II toxin-antitoxin system RelE/ParE family toxin [uncultured Gimesia sp.]|uniref:type II toxin-antitoxin system RelE/ParE family toxin n=1 Tax=uncultured Gimesia sp. TaxID=1678688 RepID=UPI0030D75BDE|tara:strand:+ start:2701 stop:2988 length:288 start_codon:yes stop_codon:yes gene_type:complete